MKFLKIFMLLSILSCTGLFLSSCEEEGENEVDGVGDNFVRLPDGSEELKVIGLDAKPGTVTINLMEILRDANSESALNQPVTVSLQLDQSVIDAYNKAHNTTFEQLPSTLYQADPLEVNFAAGDFSKFFSIKLDPTKLDLSKKYALGFKISSVNNGYKIRNGLETALYQLIIKNKFDGRYEVTGTMVDFSNAALTGLYPATFDLITNGERQVIVNDVDLGFPGHLILSSGATSYYGSFGLVVDFDDSGKVVGLRNFYGTAPNYVSANGRSAELDPSGENKWDEATKTMKIKYWMNQPSVITPHRTAFDETWTFSAAR